MTHDLRTRVAEAIKSAENGLDGDTIGTMLHDNERVQPRDGDKGFGDLQTVLLAAADAAIAAMQGQAWNFDMTAAHRDGRRILIMFVHQNAQFSRDPIGERWIAAHEAYWTECNGGGWVWYGLCGVATAWTDMPPLPSPPTEGEGNG